MLAWVGFLYVILLCLTIVLGVGIIAYVFPKRQIPGGWPLLAILHLMVLWSASMLLEFASGGYEAKLIFYNMRQIPVLALPLAWLWLAVEVNQQGFYRKWKIIALLCVFPAISLILHFTNHSLQRESASVASVYGLETIMVVRGAWLVPAAAYTYGLYMAGIIYVLDVTRRTLGRQRDKTQMLLVGVTLLLLGALSDVMGMPLFSPMGAMPIVFLPAALCFVWALFRNGSLDVLPLAYDRVLEAVSDAVIVMDRHGKIVDINRSGNELLSTILPVKQPLLGMHIRDALASWPEWKVQEAENFDHFEVTHNAESGTRIFSIDITRLNAAGGEPLGEVMLIDDITSHKQAYELHAERERMGVIQRFIQDASHDLRTPMSVIQSSSYLVRRLADKQIENLATLHPKLPQVYATIIEEAIDMTGKIRDRAVVVDDAAKRLWAILAGMIELVELESLHSLEKQKMNINQVIGDLMKRRHQDCIQRGLTVNLDFDNRMPWIIADDRRFGRAVDALILNAIQYTNRGGSICIKTGFADSMACVTVQDTGVGISADDSLRIFERFFRVDPARDMGTGGAGLGLPLAKLIAEAHGGSITVESEFGVGSTFRLFIPMELAG